MTAYVALLRAVNVGGTGKLPMEDLRAIGAACGFANVRTYIASGNLLFETGAGEAAIKATLGARLEAFAGKPVRVIVRSAAEIAAVHAADPFPDAIGARHMVFFHDAAPPADLIERVRDRAGERIALGTREVYVDYGANIRDTRLKIPGSEAGTGRNMNTVAKLVSLLT